MTAYVRPVLAAAALAVAFALATVATAALWSHGVAALDAGRAVTTIAQVL
jgi:hypothetical protein